MADDAGAMATTACPTAADPDARDVRDGLSGRTTRLGLRIAIAMFALLLAGALSGASAKAASSHASGIHKIKHVIVLMMENRSFDNYFGTYPGADGLPRSHGVFTTCMPQPSGSCQRPYHDTEYINGGGPHGIDDFTNDLNGGKMNGFIENYGNPAWGTSWCVGSGASAHCYKPHVDVMGYHTSHELPTYWSYARHFVLDDHMFEPTGGWSGVAHLFEVSQWSAQCSNGWQPSTCSTSSATVWPLGRGGTEIYCPLPRAIVHLVGGCTARSQAPAPSFAWTDMTYMLYKHHVSWRYFITPGGAPDCENGSTSCSPSRVTPGTASLWNPLVGFATVRQDNQLGNIQTTPQFLAEARTGKLPAVSWVAPDAPHSDHPPADLRTGQAFVANVVNTVERGPDWRSTAIFLAWDDWGGFYDHVRPPTVGGYQYGFRVPALTISPYAKQGYIDHQVMSFDAYNKFIEDDFLGGQRLDPRTDGRPDPRPNVRENLPNTGDLTREFNFSQRPRRPLILPLLPRGPGALQANNFFKH